MKGQTLLKITGILMIIAAVFSIFAVIFIGGMGTVAAGAGVMSTELVLSLKRISSK